MKVEFDEKAANRIVDRNGEICKEDFLKFATDTKLLDFGSAMGKKQLTPTKEIYGSQDIKSSSRKV